MQLPRPQNGQQSSLFADNFLHAELCLPQEVVPKQQQNSQESPHESSHESQNAANLATQEDLDCCLSSFFVKKEAIQFNVRSQSKDKTYISTSSVRKERLRDCKLKDERKSQNSDENKTKRSRRTAESIEKKYKCNAEFCSRSYGSEGSLQQHIKIKHPQIYQRNPQNLSDLNEQYSDDSL